MVGCAVLKFSGWRFAVLQPAGRRIGWLAHSCPTTNCTICILRKHQGKSRRDWDSQLLQFPFIQGDTGLLEKWKMWRGWFGKKYLFRSRKLLIVFHLKMVFGVHAWWTHFAFCGERLWKEFLCWETTLPSLRLDFYLKTINTLKNTGVQYVPFICVNISILSSSGPPTILFQLTPWQNYPSCVGENGSRNKLLSFPGATPLSLDHLFFGELSNTKINTNTFANKIHRHMVSETNYCLLQTPNLCLSIL